MSLMTTLRRAFGFSPDTEEEEGEYDLTVPTYAVSPTVSDTSATVVHVEEPTPAPASEASVQAKQDGDTDMAKDLPDDLFDAVINIFNQAQPEFVRECLNVEAQRQYIYNSLSDGIKKRINSALSSGNRKWDEERGLLEKRIAELEGDDNEMARLRKENRRLQLSVDRQKRALLDRINDLESQIARQSEEKERLYSHGHKHTPDSEEAAKSNVRIKEFEESEAKLQSQLDELKAELEKQTADFNEQKSIWENEKAAMTSELETAREELTRQSTLKEQLEVKTSMSDAMINDLRNQAASARGELENFQHEQETVMEQIRTQLDGFEELKARKDAKINELQESNASLRRTIETNLYNQANSEMKLRREIKDLKAEIDKLTSKESASSENGEPTDAAKSATPAEEQPKPSGRRRGRPRKVRIDSELDNTDWFAGTKADDSDFGYHEPPRRPVNDNEAQLSLF